MAFDNMDPRNARRIGFLPASQATSAASQRPPCPAAMLQFDGGESVAFEDARHNTLVLGTTGSGKTASIILPAAERLIAAGFGGLIVDIKGNFTDQIRAIARAHRREKDILELGTGPQARKINLFAGASATRISDLMQQFMLCCSASYDPNRSFHLRGLRCVVDLIVMLRKVAEYGRLPAHLCVLERMMNDPAYALKCFTRFREHIHDETDPESRDLVMRILGDRFHIVPQNAKRADDSTWQEPVGYRLGVVRTAIQMPRQTGNLEEQFFAPRKAGLDIAGEIYRRRRIVVLRLAPDSGELGAVLARTLLRDYYAAVYAHGLGLPQGRYTFCITDEAQDFISVDRMDQFNDNSFLARNREYRNINVMGTQSVAALVARTHDPEAVEAMLNNFNVRIFFYSDDPQTQRLADVHDQTPLTSYRRGQGLLVKIDAAAGRRVVGQVSVQHMHDRLQTLQAACGGQNSATALPCRPLSRQRLARKARQELELTEAYLHPLPHRGAPGSRTGQRKADKPDGPRSPFLGRELPFGQAED